MSSVEIGETFGPKDLPLRRSAASKYHMVVLGAAKLKINEGFTVEIKNPPRFYHNCVSVSLRRYLPGKSFTVRKLASGDLEVTRVAARG